MVTGQAQFPVIVVTGLSGAGKSTALNVFEDLGFYTVDGLPAGLIPKMLELFSGRAGAGHRGLVVGMDVRRVDFLREWNAALDELADLAIVPQVLFVEAKTGELLRRYSTTRRPHPLEERAPGLEQAIESERSLLAPVRERADMVLDTTQFSIHDLRRKVQEKWIALQTRQSGLRVHLITFGFKYGVPSEADFVFDMRFLPNPYFEESLRAQSGRDKPVADYVLARDPGKTAEEKLREFLLYILPLFEQEGRYRVTIAIGCTGGRHRSVAMAEAMRRALTKQEYSASLEHRHLELG